MPPTAGTMPFAAPVCVAAAEVADLAASLAEASFEVSLAVMDAIWEEMLERSAPVAVA